MSIRNLLKYVRCKGTVKKTSIWRPFWNPLPPFQRHPSSVIFLCGYFDPFLERLRQRKRGLCLNQVLVKLRCIAFCIEPWCIHIKTSETKSPHNRLEWMDLDDEQFSKRLEILMHTDRNWNNLIKKYTSYTQTPPIPNVNNWRLYVQNVV